TEKRRSDENSIRRDMSDDARVEVYIDIPEHEVRGHYGTLICVVERFDWCVRYVIPYGDGYAEPYTTALRQALQEQEEEGGVTLQQRLNLAAQYTIRVQHKHSGPYWEIKVTPDD
ncbi:MAG: hypothetical protein KGL39_60050, partial [Patescibacteria group bacterium]|nr:hypothetical protein [Patescibacteria group bacterium]